MYFDDVPDEIQPSVHVRTVNGNYLSDEQMIEYYAGLVKQYGNLTARYKNAICFVMDENHRPNAIRIANITIITILVVIIVDRAEELEA